MKTFQEWLAERDGDQIDEVGVLPIMAGSVLAASAPGQTPTLDFLKQQTAFLDAAEAAQEEAKAILQQVKNGTAKLNDPKVKMFLLYNPEHDPNCPKDDPARSDFIINQRRKADQFSQAMQFKPILDKSLGTNADLKRNLQDRLATLKAGSTTPEAKPSGADKPTEKDIFGNPKDLKSILQGSLRP